MIKFREYEFVVETLDVDFNRTANIMALGNYILHAAGKDADSIGFGVRDLNAICNSSWVLTRMAMEVERMPAEHEILRIATWVSDVSRVMTTRNFMVRSASGERIAASVTNWAMINFTTRRPQDLHDLPGYEKMEQNEPSPIDMPARIAMPETEAGKRHGHKVAYSDIDLNRHVNSMKYLQWVVDTLPAERLKDKIFARVDMNFIRESLLGDQMTITAWDEKGLYEIKNGTDDTVCRISFTMK